MKVGIVGLAQAGKTTLFNALTGAHGVVGPQHAREQVALGVVRVPDERLDRLAGLLSPREVIPATVEFEDIGGVFAHLAGAEHTGRPVAELREADCVLMLLRAFESEYVPEVLGGVDPAREHRTMTEELLLADLEVIERRLEAVARDLKKPAPERDQLQAEQQVLERCRAAVERERRLEAVRLSEAERKLLRSYSFLTLKPRVCVVNIGEDQIGADPAIGGLEGLEPPPIAVCAELEMELMDLPEDERRAFMAEAGLEELAAGRVIRACYEAAGLRSFFTHVSDKLRAWTVEAGATAREAAGKVHTDMEKGFIRAEVAACEALFACGGLKEARAAGKLRMEGKDYEVRDGDVITFHFAR